MTSSAGDSRCDEHQEGVAAIALGRKYGSSDVRTVAELERRLVEAIDGSATGLLVDMGTTVYIGCEFLNVLLRCSKRVRECNLRFALCMVSSWPKKVARNRATRFVLGKIQHTPRRDRGHATSAG